MVYNVFARLRIGCLLNLTPLYTFASKKEISISDILAVNMIAEWKLFAFSTIIFSSLFCL